MTTIFTNDQAAALDEVAGAVAPSSVVLIGAGAVGWHLGARMDWRFTADLDLILAVDLDGFATLPARLPGWTQNERREHEWHSPRGVRFDLVPAGPALLAKGSLVWPRSGHVMQLVGLELAFRHAVRVSVGAHAVGVAPIHVLALLKMGSWMDSPAREHDLIDIAHMMEGWIPDDDERRWDDDVVETQLAHEDVSAYLLGREIAAIAAPHHREVVQRFLAIVEDEGRSAHGLMLRRGPMSWRNDDDDDGRLTRRLTAFRRGMGLPVAPPRD